MSLFMNWLKSFPFIKREPIVIKANTSEIKAETCPAKFRVIKKADTLEEKIGKLEQQISWLKEDLSDESKYLKNQIQKLYKDSSERIGNVSKQNSDIGSKLETISIGGIKFQVFGVSLLVYGSIVGYFA